jgi:peptide/nickel transport system substrate-binding protein
MTKKALTIGLVLMMVLALGLLVAACGGGATTTTAAGDATTTGPSVTTGPATTAGGTTETSAPVSTDTTTSGPVKGGTLVVLTRDEGTGNVGVPWKMQSNESTTETSSVDTLVLANWDGTIEPNLAASWEIAADGSSITFALQPNVKFHDGTVCDAAAIKWNLDQWIQAGMGMTHAWTSVDAVDASHVRINLKAWQNVVLTGLADAYLGFISPTAFQANGEKWAEGNLVSTGAYKLAKVESGVGWTLERNPDWWGGQPNLDTIEFKVVKDYNTMQMMLESGQADLALMNGGEATTQNALKAKGFDLLGYEVEEPNCLYVDGVNADSPWGNKQVREAVDYAIDRDSIAALGQGLYLPTYEFVDPRSPLYDPSLERKYDPAKAKELLAAAGYAKGFETTIYTDVEQDQAAVIQQNLADIGITAEVQTVDTPAIFGMAMKGWQNGAITGPFQSRPGYMEGVANWFTGGLFVSAYRSQALQDIVNAGLAVKDLADIAPFNKQAIALLNAEVAGYPMYTPEYSIGVKATYVHDDGWGTGPTGRWTPAKCWISK